MMCWDLAKHSNPVARNEYNCDAAEWITQAWPWEDYFTEEEIEVIKNAETDNWKIRKGMRYSRIDGKWEGEWSTFRAREDLNDICLAKDVYPDC